MELEDLRAELEQLHAASYGWALRCCQGNRDDAQDVLQNAYVKALSKRARSRDRATGIATFFYQRSTNI